MDQVAQLQQLGGDIKGLTCFNMILIIVFLVPAQMISSINVLEHKNIFALLNQILDNQRVQLKLLYFSVCDILSAILILTQFNSLKCLLRTKHYMQNS